MNKYTNVRAKVFDLISKRDAELADLNGRIGEAEARIRTLETENEQVSISGDFEKFKKNRSEIYELKDLKEAYEARVKYLSGRLPLSDQELAEIREGLNKATGKLNAELISKVTKICGPIRDAKAEYEKERQELVEIKQIWNDSVPAEFRSDITNVWNITGGLERIVQQLNMFAGWGEER